MVNSNDSPKTGVPPLLLFFLLLGIASYLEYQFSFGYPLAPVAFRLPMALIFLIFSGYLAVHSAFVLKKKGNTLHPRKPPSTIVEEGPYRFSRNPMYLSLVVAFLALAVWFYSIWLYLFTSLFWLALDFITVGPEERYLRQHFGEAYDAYKSKVSRWM